jgi:hypothetical protein
LQHRHHQPLIGDHEMMSFHSSECDDTLPTSAGHPPAYNAYKGFISAFMGDWSSRTENPWEANLFYVPALSYAHSGSRGNVTVHLRRVMAWVAEAHPFFNRTGGRDHFFWLPNDRYII